MSFTRWACSRLVTSSASGVSTTTTSSRPTSGDQSARRRARPVPWRRPRAPAPASPSTLSRPSSAPSSAGERVEVADVVPAGSTGTTATRPAAAAGSATAWSTAIRGSCGHSSSSRSGSAAIVRSRCGEVRVTLGQQVEQHPGPGHEHAGVPAVRAAVDVLLRPRRPTASRRTSTARWTPGVAGQGLAEVDVAEAGGGVGRGDAQGHQPVVAGDGDRPARTASSKAAGSATTWSAANEPITASGVARAPASRRPARSRPSSRAATARPRPRRVDAGQLGQHRLAGGPPR